MFRSLRSLVGPLLPYELRLFIRTSLTPRTERYSPDNVVEANLLAATAPEATGEVFNVGCGSRVSLLQIIRQLEAILGCPLERRHTPRRAGDVDHTQADISKAKRLLGYVPPVDFEAGLGEP